MGYPTEWFTKDSGFDEYLCPICLLVVEDAHAGAICGHLICDLCCKKISKCPTCQQNMTWRPSPETKRRIDNLKVHSQEKEEEEEKSKATTTTTTLVKLLRDMHIGCRQCKQNIPTHQFLFHWHSHFEDFEKESITRCVTPGCIQKLDEGENVHKCVASVKLLEPGMWCHQIRVSGLDSIAFLSGKSPIVTVFDDNVTVKVRPMTQGEGIVFVNVAANQKDQKLIQYVHIDHSSRDCSLNITGCHSYRSPYFASDKFDVIVYYSLLS